MEYIIKFSYIRNGEKLSDTLTFFTREQAERELAIMSKYSHTYLDLEIVENKI